MKLEDIYAAREVLKGVVHMTPLFFSQSCTDRAGNRIFLKGENEQRTGSFKIRGAFNKIHHLTKKERESGVVASSAGNHAQGVALAGREQNVGVTVVMPTTAPLVKVEATKSYGAEVILHGALYDDAYEKAREIERLTGKTFVHPYDDPYVIAGQGTVALELLDQNPNLDTVVVCVGGGGLISGIAVALKSLKPSIKVFGVQAQAAPSLYESFKRKSLFRVDQPIKTIADGVAVKNPSETILKNYLLGYVDDFCTVTEDEIADAIVFVMERAKSVVEGSGVLGLAAVLNGHLKLGKETAIVLSGGNIDLKIISRVIDRGLKKTGRLARIRVAVEDKPGILADVAGIIAGGQANVLEVFHNRNQEGLFLQETSIEFVVETNSHEHVDRIKQVLCAAGHRIY
ncbi:MAG: threonine ammonia-lyase [Bdellovibrionales bacterium CG10_big_fil_rev_8_21_14_0_10_45_34]|nr:MAG: threonine ammonia-lyase [Bdellovibrionales bacterium CG10_big_fil_rev_8_21_14_0_10_45_34]